jgi:Trk-type K+ transport system membrane component
MKRPGLVFLFSYIVIVALGAMLLSLKGISTAPLTSTKALFTSVSAVTLTGADIVSFADNFTVLGQCIVLLLIQTGAILNISFCLFFAYLSGRGKIFDSGLESVAKPGEAFISILTKTMLFLLVFEIISSVILYAFWKSAVPIMPQQKMYYAFFHGVSVFCHAGFSALPGGFSNPAVNDSYLLLLAVTGVSFLGLVGYPVIIDLVSVKRLRGRMANPELNWQLHTRVIVYGVIILLAAGSIVYFLLGQHSFLAQQKLLEGVFSSMMNASGSMAGGFYSLSVNSYSVLMLFAVLMFIGAAPASGSGGVKMTSLYLLSRRGAASKMAIVMISYAVLVIAIGCLLFMLTGTLSAHAFYYSLSSFCNVKLPESGLIPSMQQESEYYISMLLMLLGRIGIPVVGFSVMRRLGREEVLVG